MEHKPRSTEATITSTLPNHSPPSHDVAADTYDSSEKDLIKRCQAGESAAWDTLIKRYEPPVFKFAYSLCHSQDDADDITGRVFLRVYRNLNTFRHESSFRSWLFRIVRNSYVDMCLRAAHRRNVSLDAVPISSGEAGCSREIVDPKPGPEQKCLDSEIASLIDHAIRHLPAYQREVVQMYHIEGKSYGDIADAAGLSVGTVKSRLNRARINLRERLTPLRDSITGG
jgi:RNA polymerase sigma-70 factor (ECF subfamily)